MKRHFSKEEIQTSKEHMKRCPASLSITEMQGKSTRRCHFIPTRMATFKQTGHYKSWKGCEDTGTLTHSCWECQMLQLL